MVNSFPFLFYKWFTCCKSNTDEKLKTLLECKKKMNVVMNLVTIVSFVFWIATLLKRKKTIQIYYLLKFEKPRNIIVFTYVFRFCFSNCFEIEKQKKRRKETKFFEWAKKSLMVWKHSYDGLFVFFLLFWIVLVKRTILNGEKKNTFKQIIGLTLKNQVLWFTNLFRFFVFHFVLSAETKTESKKRGKK